MYRVGEAIYWKNGWGFNRNPRLPDGILHDMGDEWFEKAARAGHIEAYVNHLYNLKLYTRGESEIFIPIPKHDDNTEILSASETFAIALCYHWGVGGIEENESKAKRFFEMSAVKGSEFGQYMFGYMEAQSGGSLFWVEKSASVGNYKAREWIKHFKELMAYGWQ
jgi:TPR repeat protein